MRRILFILALFTFSKICPGQTNATTSERSDSPESFLTLTDTLIKNEMTMFNFKGTLMTGTSSSRQSTLTEIPLRHCDGKTLDFSKGNIFIHVYFKQGENTNENQSTTYYLDSIFLVTHAHYWVKFPKSAFVGISNIISCTVNKEETKSLNNSPSFKAFQSEDKRRIYIYLIGGLDKEKYEATWVIKNGEFYTRTIDSI